MTLSVCRLWHGIMSIYLADDNGADKHSPHPSIRSQGNSLSLANPPSHETLVITDIEDG